MNACGLGALKTIDHLLYPHYFLERCRLPFCSLDRWESLDDIVTDIQFLLFAQSLLGVYLYDTPTPFAVNFDKENGELVHYRNMAQLLNSSGSHGENNNTFPYSEKFLEAFRAVLKKILKRDKKKWKVLYVDDENDDCPKKFGMSQEESLIECLTPAQSMDKKSTPETIWIVDIVWKDPADDMRTGIDLIRKIRGRERNAKERSPIIVYSAFTSPLLFREAMKLSADNVVPKMSFGGHHNGGNEGVGSNGTNKLLGVCLLLWNVLWHIEVREFLDGIEPKNLSFEERMEKTEEILRRFGIFPATDGYQGMDYLPYSIVETVKAKIAELINPKQT